MSVKYDVTVDAGTAAERTKTQVIEQADAWLGME